MITYVKILDLEKCGTLNWNIRGGIISPGSYNYNEKVTDFIQAQEFYEQKTDAWRTRVIDRFMNHGWTEKMQNITALSKIKLPILIFHNRETLACTHLYGLLISFGTI